ncbi:MAG: hypothetical protein K2O28_00820 [Clostridia bacterium]|nr:hypothetical protein [Clostridia bacterium]
MDKSIILSLVFDGRCYGDNIVPSKNEEYRKNSDEFEKLLEKLLKGLPEEEKKKIEWDLSVAHSGMASVAADEFFKAGFKLGLKIGAQNFLE